MSSIDYAQRRIVSKLVYFGPQGSGKTTAVRHVYQRTKAPDAPPTPPRRDDGPHYDYLPLKLGEIRGFTTHFELFTVPGGDDLGDARQELLADVDGVIFLADAQPHRRAANGEAMRELEAHLASHGFVLAKLPLVVQLNKMDLLGDGPPADLNLWLPPALRDVGVIPSIATDGTGVFDALKAICKGVLTELKKTQ